MALPLLHTMSRNRSIAAISASKYDNIRIFGLSGNMVRTGVFAPMAKLKQEPNNQLDYLKGCCCC